MNRICQTGIVLLASVVLFFPALSAPQQRKVTKVDPPTKAKSVVEALAVSAGVRYQSQGRRDPFFNPLLKKPGKVVVDEEEPRGLRPPGIGGMSIDQVALLGIASQEEDQVAIFRGSDGRAYFLHQGDRLYDGSVAKIGADTVTLVRETKFRSGKVLRQEATKRLRPL
ncbi:MAG TPA: hypothetical protein VE398_17260 [Acidobacteriota bacterium]|nr:hypothetical protein [Acidobacteriota bacterium]